MKSTGERGVCVPIPHRTADLREAVVHVVAGAGQARGTAACAAAAWPSPRHLGRPAYTQQALEVLGRVALRRCLPGFLSASAARQPHVRLYQLPRKSH